MNFSLRKKEKFIAAAIRDELSITILLPSEWICRLRRVLEAVFYAIDDLQVKPPGKAVL